MNTVTGRNYARYKMEPERGEYSEWIRIDTFRTKLGSLISRLHAEYFPDDPPPFSGMPSTLITQTQQQSQSFQVELVFEMVSKIDEQLSNLDPDDKRRGFLEKVKGALKSVRNAAELIALYLTTAKEFGLTVEEVLGLFK